MKKKSTSKLKKKTHSSKKGSKKVQKKKLQKKGFMKSLMSGFKKAVAKKPAKKVKKIVKKQKFVAKKVAKPAKKIPMEAPSQETLPTDVIVFSHVPVLVQEVLEHLQLEGKKVVVDGTLGLGGHAQNMLEKMDADARLFGFDVDDDNMSRAQQNLINYGDRVVLVRSNFGNLQEELSKLKVRSADAILLDLGLSSPQVDNPVKGFSFLREGPLDMRFDKLQPLTAADVINTYSGGDLQKIFFEFGEERFARKIASEIVKRRKARSFKTTTELANFIEKLMGRQGHLHPATRVFQALRIEVNHELDVLKNVLQQAESVLKKGGRLAVIAYHSLEDRVVKQFLKERARDFINEPHKLTTTHLKPTFGIVTKKPLVPTDAEISKNPRSRSAKLRVAQKL